MNLVSDNANNKLGDFFNRHHLFAVFLVLAAVIFVSGYWHFRNLGVYGDDWGGMTFIFQADFYSAIADWWRMGSAEVGNFRPLAVILPALWYIIFKFLGLSGIVLFNFFCYSFLAWLGYILLKQHVSTAAALFGALLFALYPTNTAYLWQVTLSYTFSLIAVFLAVYFFNKQKFLACILFLFFGLLINEGTYFIFAFALLPPAAANWATVRMRFGRWFLLAAGVVLAYAAARVGLEMTGITGGARSLYVLNNLNFVSYAAQFFKGLILTLFLSWGIGLWKLYNFFQPAALLAGAFAALVFFKAAAFFCSKEQNGFLTRSAPSLVMLLGALLVFAGRYYGFYFVPSINILNLDSRYYFAASVGGMVFFAGLLQYLLSRFASKARLLLMAAAVVLAAFASVKFLVQNDYRDAWVNSKKIWQQLVYILPKVPDQGFAVFDITHKILGKPVVEFEAVGDLRVILPLLNKTDIAAVTSPYITNMGWTATEVCITSPPAPPFYDNTCFQKALYSRYAWKNGELMQIAGQSLPQAGALKMPENFKRLLDIK